MKTCEKIFNFPCDKQEFGFSCSVLSFFFFQNKHIHPGISFGEGLWIHSYTTGGTSRNPGHSLFRAADTAEAQPALHTLLILTRDAAPLSYLWTYSEDAHVR